MLLALFLGFVLGFILSFSFGTIFFTILQESLLNNKLVGMKIASGVIIADILLILIALFGMRILPQASNFTVFLKITSIVLLIFLALSQIFSPQGAPIFTRKKAETNSYVLIAKGFLLNALNPANFLAWALVIHQIDFYKFTPKEKFFFFLMALISTFIWESLLGVLIHRYKNLFKPKFIQHFKYIISAIFIGLAIKLVFDFFE
jgi:L-lysine exporter family protein LysE/ArgO